jgi:hypothetical protein
MIYRYQSKIKCFKYYHCNSKVPNELASTHIQNKEKQNIKAGMGMLITWVFKEKIKRDKMYPEDLEVGS